MNIKVLAYVVAFGTGFVSLGIEILWTRILGFTQGQTPQVFALVLGLFLFGIVIGSAWGKRITLMADVSIIRRHASIALLCSFSVDALTPFIWAYLVGNDAVLAIPLAAVLIPISSATKAVLFPIAHHLGTTVSDVRLGRSLSSVYGLNILGSTSGAACIGFIALEWAGTPALLSGLSVIIALLALLLWPPSQSRVQRAVPWTVCVLLVLSIQPMQQINHSFWPMLATAGEVERIGFMAENRSGLVHTLKDAHAGDVIYGGNVYDGRLNVDPRLNSNRIDRLILLSALHPNPKRILVIGLSGGAWVEILRHLPDVVHIDVVEIQPLYLDLIALTPAVSGLLKDSRVHIHIDDGRRWVKRNETQRYDLIVMNTTFHWRAYITNLLSREFLEIMQLRLQPGGILAFNSTGSPDVLKTAEIVFSSAYRYSNFVYAANWDFRKIESENLDKMTQLIYALLPSDEVSVKSLVEKWSTPVWVDVQEEERLAGRTLEIITEENLITEYKYGKPF
jgi:spermidine synthase